MRFLRFAVLVNFFSVYLCMGTERTIFVLTTTVARQTQLPEIIRLGNTLNLIEHLHWIIISNGLRPEIKRYLDRLKIGVTTLDDHQGDAKAFRTTGMNWIVKNFHTTRDLVTFIPTDYVLDIRYFNEIRHSKTISIWPVENVHKRPMEFLGAFTIQYLQTNGIENIYNQVGDKKFQDKFKKILVWKLPIKLQSRADKSKWTNFENTNMDALDSQIY